MWHFFFSTKFSTLISVISTFFISLEFCPLCWWCFALLFVAQVWIRPRGRLHWGENLKFFHFCFGRVRIFIRIFYLMNIWDFASDQVTWMGLLRAPVNSKINFKCWECDLEGRLRKNGRNLLCSFHNPAGNIYDNFINTWYGSLTFHTHVCTALRGIGGGRGVEKRNRQKHNENKDEKVRS